MPDKFRVIKNPLTIIGIFAGILEVAGIWVLPSLSEANQGIFVWFLIAFPVLLVVLFFLTLNFNPKALYSPGDYREDASFLAAMNIKNSQIPSSHKGISVGEVAKNE